MAENILIVVQARMSSTRLPGKVMMPIMGKTLLAQMVRRLQMIRYRASIVIATTTDPEDDIIEAEAAMLKIASFRGDRNNLLDRHYQAAKKHQADIVLKIPSDCPLIDPRIIDQCLDYFFKYKNRFDFVSNLHPATWPDGNDVEIMTMDCLSRAWQQAILPMEQEHTTPYIWENPQLFKIGNVSWDTGLDYSMSHRFTIDYADDYAFIKQVYQELYPTADDFSCQDILDLLARKPGIYELNKQYIGVNWYRHHLNELKTITHEQTSYEPGDTSALLLNNI